MSMTIGAIQKELDHLRSIHVIHFLFVAVLGGLVGSAWFSGTQSLEGELDSLERLLVPLRNNKVELAEVRTLFQTDLKMLTQDVVSKLGLAFHLRIHALEDAEAQKFETVFVRDTRLIPATALVAVQEHSLDDFVDWMSRVTLRATVVDEILEQPATARTAKCYVGTEQKLSSITVARGVPTQPGAQESGTMSLSGEKGRRSTADGCLSTESMDFTWKPGTRDFQPDQQFFRQLFPQLDQHWAEIHDKNLSEIRDWIRQTPSRVSRSIENFNVIGISVRVRDHFVAVAITSIVLLSLYMLLCLVGLRAHGLKESPEQSSIVPTWIVVMPGVGIWIFAAMVLWILPTVIVYITLTYLLNKPGLLSFLLAVPTGILGMICHYRGRRLLFSSSDRFIANVAAGVRVFLDKRTKRQKT